jgi:hypothetical protein
VPKEAKAIRSGQAPIAARLTWLFLLHSLAGVPIAANSPDVPVFVEVSNET